MATNGGFDPGDVLGDFEIRARLGQGGMGVVYRAFDRRHGGEVALKLLPEHLAADAVFLERFRREARAAFELRDPHVVPVHGFGEIDGRLYLSMQLIDGTDLARLLADRGPLSADRAAGVVRQAAHALSAAHASNLVHRDVKPSNLLVVENRDWFTYLVDFGIAHVVGRHTVGTSLTSTGATIGTLAYIAPERLRGEAHLIDGRVDVYALTCVLVEMLTGRPPFPSTDPPALITAHLVTPPPRVTDQRPDLSPTWDAVVARGMAKEPAQRYATAADLAADVQRAALGQAPDPSSHARPGPPPTVVPQQTPPPTRVPWHAPTPTQVPWQQLGATAPGHPVPAGPGQRAGMTGWMVAAVCIGVVIALSGVLWVLTQSGTGAGRQADAADRTSAVPAPTTLPAPTTGADVVEPASAPGDLGLGVPISTVPCTGGYAVFVGAGTEPSAYRSQVQSYLDTHPGARYLRAEDNCGSLRQRMPDGASIYAVYYGPYPSLGAACAQRAAAGGDSYVRVLDDSTPPTDDRLC